MSAELSGLRPGMQVVGSDGHPFGEVTQVRRDDFLVHRGLKLDLYVLKFAVRAIDGNTVVLKAPGDRIVAMDWGVPAIHGVPTVGTPANVEEVTDAADTSWPRENLPPHRPWHDLLQPGQRVITRDGAELGQVKTVEPQRFLVDRSLARDLWLPDRFIDHIAGDAVTLRLTQEGVETMPLEEPPL